MPMDRARYPKNWIQIAFAIKETAGWKCKMCGKQCRRPTEPFDTHKRTLTVAHLNHIPEKGAAVTDGQAKDLEERWNE